MDIISYQTFKKRYNPSIFESRDGGGKGWCRETVDPTLFHHKWNRCITENDYGLTTRHGSQEKPKQMAIRLLMEVYGERWCSNKKFVYYMCEGVNDYMDILYIYYKDKEEAPTVD